MGTFSIWRWLVVALVFGSKKRRRSGIESPTGTIHSR